MTKDELRKIYKKKRNELSSHELKTISEAIAAHVVSEITLTKQVVHLFLPIARLHEINTQLIRDRILEMHPAVTFCISRSIPETGEMEHIIWNHDTVLEPSEWGIPEPKGGKRVKETLMDLVFVPLLAFDHSGNRLGYGKGFYDRFLSRCRSDCRFIGLSHFPPSEHLIVPDSWDITLHQCITPQRVFTFG